MAEIHDTTIVRGDVELAADVEIGPFCVIDGTLGPVRVAEGTRLLGNSWLYGPVTIGAHNAFYPATFMGMAPQSRSYDHAKPGCGLVIGDHNVFREHVTLHRASTEDGPTTVGDDNYFMSNTHAGHDCRIGNHCTIAQGAVVGGHVRLDDQVTIGGAAAIHQFSRIGRGAMIGGGLASPHDVPPYFVLTANGVVGSVNVVGIRRQGLPRDVVEDIRWVYKTLYRRSLPVSAALTELKSRADRPIVAEYVEFIESSQRGISSGHGLRKRNA